MTVNSIKGFVHSSVLQLCGKIATSCDSCSSFKQINIVADFAFNLRNIIKFIFNTNT